MTPRELCNKISGGEGRTVHGLAVGCWCEAIQDAIRAAEADGRAAALEERDAEWRKAIESWRKCSSKRLSWTSASLINQGRDEVAPSTSRVSPEKDK